MARRVIAQPQAPSFVWFTQWSDGYTNCASFPIPEIEPTMSATSEARSNLSR